MTARGEGARNTGPLFPVDALVRAARVESRLALDAAIGRRPAWANRMHARGGLTVRQADEAAIALDLHPVLVWGDDWLTEDETERRAA